MKRSAHGSALMAGLLIAGLTAGAPADATAQSSNYYSAGDGLRFGVFGQYGITGMDIADQTAGRSYAVSPQSARFGASFGYDWRFGITVLGVEADAAVSNANASVAGYTFASDYVATFRGRLGFYARPDILLYGTAGLALTGVEYKPASTSALKLDATLVGGTVGVGTEVDWYGMRFFGEYLYAGYGDWSFTSLGSGGGNRLAVSTDQHMVRLGVKFNLSPEYDVKPYK